MSFTLRACKYPEARVSITTVDLCSAWMYPSGNAREALNDRKFVNSPDAFDRAMDGSDGLAGFGAYASSPDSVIFYHGAESTDAGKFVPPL